LNDGRFQVIDAVEETKNAGVELVIVAIDVGGYYERFLNDIVGGNRQNLIKFTRGRLGAQREKVAQLLDSACQAMTFDVFIPPN